MAEGLERMLEADDGVIEVDRVGAVLDFPWVALPAGPRRWAPTDLSVEVDGDRVSLVCTTYRALGDRVVVLAAGGPEVDADDVGQRLSTPLPFAHVRAQGAGMRPEELLATLRGQPVWDGEAPPHPAWRYGTAGVGDRPVRVAHQAGPDGHLLLAAHGVALEEVRTIVDGLERVAPGSPEQQDLHVRYRRALAQRWWDAPRTPWTPDQRAQG
jgi:hypothetical protein